MAGGQAITSALGTIIAEGGDNNVAMTGSAATGATGTLPSLDFVPLRSRKVGGGTASVMPTGQAVTVHSGTLAFFETYPLTGFTVTLAQGTLLYRGRATISWNAVTTNADGTPITDLAGYRILHGTQSGVYNGADTVTLGIQTSYVYGGLLPGFTHYFVVQAYDTDMNFSANSAQVSKAY